MSDLESRLRAAQPIPPVSPLADERAREAFRARLAGPASTPRSLVFWRRRLVLVAVGILVFVGGAAAVVSSTGVLSGGTTRAGAGDVGALSASGEVAVWSERRADGPVVVAAHRTPSGQWYAGQVLGRGSSPAVAGVGGDSVVAVWASAAGVQSSHFDGASWSAPVLISGSAAGKTIKLRLAYGASGALVAAWEVVGVPQRALVATYAAGRWSPATEVPRPPGASSFAPVVAQSGDGTTVAVWQSLSPRGSAVLASVRTSAGWSAPRRLAVARSAGDADVSFDQHGRAFAVWHQSDGMNDSATMVSRWEVDGGWSAPRRVSPPGGLGLMPKVAGQASGALIAWVQAGNAWTDPNYVEVATVDAEGRPSSPTRASGGSTPGITLALAVSSGNGAAVVWTRRPSENESVIEAASVRGDGTVGTPRPIPSRGFALYPSASFTDAGELLVLWTKTSPAPSSVMTAALRLTGG